MSTDKDTLKKKTIPLLRAVLTAKAKVGVPLHMLCREFEETCMESLKFREMGYGSLEQFLRDCSETCTVERAKEGYLVVKGIASKEDAHIFKLVSGQRKDKKKSKKVSLNVKFRKACHFTGGNRPNSKPSISRYNRPLPTPQRGSLLGNPAANSPFLSAVPYNSNQYTQLRRTPSKAFYIMPTNSTYNASNNIPPRFQKLRQNNPFPFVNVAQAQVNNKALSMIPTNTKPQSTPHTAVVADGPDNVRSSLSTHEKQIPNINSDASNILTTNLSNLVPPTKQSTTFKSLLNEYCHNKKLPTPTYDTVPVTGGFISTVHFKENDYKGMCICKKRKDAEQKAAHVAWNALAGIAMPTNQKMSDGAVDVAKMVSSTQQKHETYLSLANTEELPYTDPDLLALEKKLRKLLISKTNGLWATRLRPEFKNMYGELLPDDIRKIIQENFLSFIKIDSPMPNMEILYFKEAANAPVVPVDSQSSQKDVDINKNEKNGLLYHPSLDSQKVLNGVSSHQPLLSSNDVISIDEPLPDVICTSPPIEVPSLNFSQLRSSKKANAKSTSPCTSEFKIEYPELPNVGDEIKVFVCHVESLDRFFVQYADSDIQALVDEMQVYYEEATVSENIGKPKFNEYCCARYSKDKLWFRSKILSVKEQKNILNESYRCRVIYVDYGNDEYVISTELKCLTDDFCKMPAQAIQCCLHNLYPMEGTTWSEKIIEYFRNATDNVELTMAVKAKNGPVLTIDLIDVEGRSVCAYFANSKWAKLPLSPQVDNILSSENRPRSASPRTPPLSDSETVTLPPSNREIKARYVVAPEEQDYIDVSVSHINSTNDIAIILIGPEYDEQLDKLEEKMNKYYERGTVLPAASLEVDNFYAVYYEDYWVRAKLLAVFGSEIEVTLLDHGNKTIVSREEIKDLPMQFLDPPFQAIPCSLANVPESFDAEILQYLTENTLRKAMIGYIVARCTGPGLKMSIELYDTTNESDDININNEIIEKIENEKNLCPTLPNVGEGHCNAYIAHVSQDGEVFIQILGPGTERLEILMEDMTSHFTQTRASEIVQRPEVGNICCAKFIEDGAWYRAKVTKVIHKERKVEVEFIDYGNSEIIQMLFIRNPDAVNKKVVSLPAQAVKCYISGNLETSMDDDTYKKMREFIQTLDVVYVTVVGYNDTVPVINILVPSELGNGEPTEFFERYEYEQLEEVKRISESSSSQQDTSSGSSVFNTTYKTATSFNSIANFDNTSFEDISVAGEESFCKINPVRTNDSNTLLSEYDVISNPAVKDVEKTWREKNRSESPAFFNSSTWGIPRMGLTERVIEGVIQDSHDPSKFSFIPFRLWEALETLHVDMMETYKDSPSDNVMIDIGGVCAVYHHKHEIWYRAVIVAKIDDEVVVKYPDFSGTAEVEFSKNVRRLLPKFKELPFLAVRCNLAGVEPITGAKNWDSQAAGLFNEMVMNETFQVEVVSNNFNNDFSKPLEVLLHGASADGKRFIINEKLVKMGFAKKSR